MDFERQEVFVAPAEGDPFVYCELTQDEVFSDGFPAGWGVRHVPSTNATHLFGSSNDSERAICERPRSFTVEEWAPLARTMALGLYAHDKLLAASLQKSSSTR